MILHALGDLLFVLRDVQEIALSQWCDREKEIYEHEKATLVTIKTPAQTSGAKTVQVSALCCFFFFFPQRNEDNISGIWILTIFQ